MTDEASRRVVRIWSENAAVFARVLSDQDPSWGTETFPLAGGHAVLCGPGPYVNQLMAAGLDASLTCEDLDRIEHRCVHVGVPPAVETTSSTQASTFGLLADRGYRRTDETSALVRGLDDVDQLPAADPSLAIGRADGARLSMWQETSAAGWGHGTRDARRASDTFARAAAVVDGEHIVAVRATESGGPVASAGLTIRHGIATLGGVSTVPAERNRGVQSALIHHRLRAAHISGCDLATSTDAPDGTSERNLIRHGFCRWDTVTIWTRSTRLGS